MCVRVPPVNVSCKFSMERGEAEGARRGCGGIRKAELSKFLTCCKPASKAANLEYCPIFWDLSCHCKLAPFVQVLMFLEAFLAVVFKLPCKQRE